MKSNKLSKVFAVLLSFVLIFSAVGISAYGASTEELNKKKEKIQAQIDEANKKISSLKTQKDKTQALITELDKKIELKKDKIDVLQAEVNALQSEITTVQNNIDKTEAKIEKTQKDIDAKQAEFDKTYEEYCQRLRAMYISGSASNLEVIMTCEDISSILTRSQMIKSVSEKDSAALESLMKKMSEIEKEKAELEKNRNSLKENKQKLKSDKAKLDDNLAQIKAEKAELDKEVAEQNATMRKLSSQTAEYQESIETNQAQLAAVQNQLNAAYASASRGTGSTGGSAYSGSTGTGVPTGNGRLGYPTSYRGISAGYPNYSSGRYHGGVDFPCPSGTPVHAAEAGTVILALNLNYSYGHYIIVDHGNGLSTLYAHNTTLVAGVGTRVSRGQVIAYSGSTGNSTGPHCHFEVRVNGQRVNPLSYL